MEKKYKKIITEMLNKTGKDKILIVILIGVLLTVISLPVKKNNEERQGDSENLTVTTNSEKSSNYMSDYQERLENSLSELLSKVEGAGEVRVMVSFKSTGEAKLAADVDYSRETITKSDDTSTKTIQDSEKNSNNPIFYDSNDGTKPYILSETMPEIGGIIVVAKGAGNGSVSTDISQAVEALLGLPMHKIKVLKMS